MRKDNSKRIWTIAGCSAAVFILILIFAIMGLVGSVREVAENTLAKMPDALLASSGVVESEDTLLSVIYYDQKEDECVNLYDLEVASELKDRQFEWTRCGYERRQIEEGLVGEKLDGNYLPIWRGGELLPNKDGKDISRWFNTVEGKSKNYAGTLRLKYDADKAEFSYEAEEFYPIDDANFSSGDAANADGHNHLFTMNFAAPFRVLRNGEEEFSITADDDTFVFVDTELAIDMGGIHGETTGTLKIGRKGEVYVSVLGEEFVDSGIRVDGISMIRVYHADRDSRESIFKVRFSGMNLEMVEAKIAGAENGVQIAYDPNDPSYIPPLGESAVFLPDKTKEYVLLATIEGALIAALAILLVISIRIIARSKIEE